VTSFDYARPSSLSEAFELQRTLSDALFVAGGTDLLLRIREGRLHPKTLISLNRIEELRGIRLGDPTWIGATTPVADLLEHAELCARFPVLCQAAKTLGSAQIRNVATVGGNLINASPCADLAPPLLVSDARVVLQSATRVRELTLEELFVAPGETRLGPGELLTAVLIDSPPPARRAVFEKISRVSMDISIASVALALDVEAGVCRRARVAAGSVAPRPVRLIEAERALEGRKLDASLAAAAAARASEEVRPITDIRSTAEYRRHVVGVLVRRGLEKLAKGETA
jgi:carbon-monoxide dehydrogenase medium subunit